MLLSYNLIRASALVKGIRTLCGPPPIEFIRENRLQRALYFIQQKQFETISEVCYEVGYENPSYFAKLFAKRFGKSPSEYMS